MGSKKPVIFQAGQHLPWLNFSLLCLLLSLVAFRSGSTPEPVLVGEVPASAVSTSDVEESFELARQSLAEGDFESSYDMLLVASRLAPSDPRLFELLTEYIEKATATTSDETTALAEDLLGRGDALVYFQRPQNVSNARNRLSTLRGKFVANEPAISIAQPLDGVLRLIAVGKDTTQGVPVRTRASDQARSILDDLQLQLAIGELPPNDEINSEKLAQVYSEIDVIEKECIALLFGQLQPKVDTWTSAANAAIKSSDSASAEQLPQMGQQLKTLVDSGYALLQEIIPYTKSDVPAAKEQMKAVESLVESLQKQKSWIYNKATLERIRRIESATDQTAQEKIRWLAEVSEELLSPYVLRRHNELWEKVFEELPNEDEKVNSVRLRVLRVNQ